MDELRLEGMHDDGEHLVLQDASGTRHLLTVDQQLRQAVQRARRTPLRRTKQSADFGPRDIQARFRAGISLEEIAEESGWEPERVRRYEWPILAERGHMAREAQKVEIGARRTQGYRSAFEDSPLTLAQTVQTRASELGIAPTSFDWDAWQRPDLLWTVVARFRLADPSQAPQDLVDQQLLAQWVFNPANLSVTPEPGWALPLTGQQEQQRPLDGVFGTQTAEEPQQPAAEPRRSEAGAQPSAAEGRASESEAPVSANVAEASEAADESAPAAVAAALPGDQSTEELLDVLEARRGRRIGTDESSDDQLAEILGRTMGQVEHRPRPISAPQDSEVFTRPLQPGRTPSTPTDDDARHSAGEHGSQPDEGAEEQTPSTEDSPGDSAQTASSAAESEASGSAESEAAEPRDATIHRLGRADAGEQHDDSAVVEITDDDDQRPVTAPTPIGSAARFHSAGVGADEQAESAPEQETDSAAEQASGDQDGQDGQNSSDADAEAGASRPRPRNRVGGGKRTRSSVPSWDDIVFGSKTD